MPYLIRSRQLLDRFIKYSFIYFNYLITLYKVSQEFGIHTHPLQLVTQFILVEVNKRI